MAGRTITTTILLAGEQEYRAAVKGIQAEYKTLQAELKYVDSAFKDQQNSMQALTAKQQALEKIITNLNAKIQAEQTAMEKAASAQSQFAAQADAARTAIQQKQAALAQLRSMTGDTSAEEAKLTAEIKKLQAELNLNEKNAQKAALAVQQHAQASFEAATKANNFQGELNKTNTYLDEAKASSDGCATSIDFLGREIKGAGDEGGTASGIFEVLKGKFAGLLTVAGVTAAIKKFADAIRDAVRSSIAFESALTGVAKTTNLEGPALEEMGQQILDITTKMPIAATEFAKIVESAGQLGVANESLIGFSKVMANLGVATNMTADEAATMLAQFTAITGMAQTTENFEALGAAVVQLGNNFATTESKIVELARGVAGAGSNAGMTEANMIAWSTAVSSIGMESAAGATNLSKLITSMQTAVETGEDLNLWAEACGMTTAQLSALWRTDANSALLSFIRNVDDGNVSLQQMLAQLGLNDVRMQKMVTSLVNVESEQGMVTRAIEMSNGAWSESTALTEEAGKRYETTESKLTNLSNAVERLRIELGEPIKDELADNAESLATMINNFVEFRQNAIKNSVSMMDEYTANMDFVSGVKEAADTAKDTIVEAYSTVGQSVADAFQPMNLAAETALAELEEAVAAYEQAYAAALDVAQKTFGIMDQVNASYAKGSKEVKKNIEGYTQSLEDQTSYWERYTENIKAAKDAGLSDELLSSLSDGSVKSAEMLDSIVQGGESAVTAMNITYAHLAESQAGFADAVATAQTDLDGSIDEMVAKMEEMAEKANRYGETYGAGSSTVQGLIDGLNSRIGMLRIRVSQINNLMSQVGKGGGITAGRFASGLEYVPYDEFPALLHKGEMVLTAFEASAYRAQERVTTHNTSSVVNNKNYGGNSIVINTQHGQNAREIADLVMDRIQHDVSRKVAVFQ